MSQENQALSDLTALSAPESAVAKELPSVRSVEHLATVEDKRLAELRELSKRDLVLAEQIAKVRSVRRSETLAAWNDYIGFGVSKLSGITGLVVGALEFVDPNFLTLVLPNPGLVVGAALALLTGKTIASSVIGRKIEIEPSPSTRSQT